MPNEETKFCPYCGVQLEKRYEVCPNCGKPQPDIENSVRRRAIQRKNPMLAAILSLIITGTGQIYVGKVMRGIAYLVGVLFISVLLDGIISFDEMMLLGVAISIVSALDAYRLAKEVNE